jgi:hypothetical protein
MSSYRSRCRPPHIKKTQGPRDSTKHY